MPDGVHKTVDLGVVEAAFADAVRSGELDDRERPLEDLVDRLLFDVADVVLDTDGLIISLEHHTGDLYVAVGYVWMLNGPQEPVHVRFTLDGHGAITSGDVHFGLSEQTHMNHKKSVKVLLAYPEDAGQRVPWAFTFRRTDTGWQRAH